MPETVGGIPLHPLVVHGAVVLVPLAALGVIVLALVPRWRSQYSVLAFLLALAATVNVQIAKMTGETLEDNFGEVPKIERHAELGDVMLWFTLPLLAASIVIWWLGRRAKNERPLSSGLAILLSVLCIVAASAALVQVIRVGHSGAAAVWSGTVSDG